MKTCTKCGQEKPLSEFYGDKNRSGGHFNWCKGCMNKYNAQYKQTLIGKEAQARADKKYDKKYPERYKARYILKDAIRGGKIISQPCVICSSMENIRGHHEDYSQPLAVVWLCDKHHREYHNQERLFRTG